jgi:hypothetical protein
MLTHPGRFSKSVYFAKIRIILQTDLTRVYFAEIRIILQTDLTRVYFAEIRIILQTDLTRVYFAGIRIILLIDLTRVCFAEIRIILQTDLRESPPHSPPSCRTSWPECTLPRSGSRDSHGESEEIKFKQNIYYKFCYKKYRKEFSDVFVAADIQALAFAATGGAVR